MCVVCNMLRGGLAHDTPDYYNIGSPNLFWLFNIINTYKLLNIQTLE